MPTQQADELGADLNRARRRQREWNEEAVVALRNQVIPIPASWFLTASNAPVIPYSASIQLSFVLT